MAVVPWRARPMPRVPTNRRRRLALLRQPDNEHGRSLRRVRRGWGRV